MTWYERNRDSVIARVKKYKKSLPPEKRREIKRKEYRRAKEKDPIAFALRSKLKRDRRSRDIRNAQNISNSERAIGATKGIYAALLHTQMGRCAICSAHYSTLSQRLSIDHCHKTGVVRGLLCHQCNAGLGFFKDDASRLNAAVAYILK